VTMFVAVPPRIRGNQRANKHKERVMSEFVIAEVLPGKLNALVKNLMKATGIRDPNEAVRAINAGEWSLSPVTKAVEKLLKDLEMVTVVIDPAINFSECLKTCDAMENVEALQVCLDFVLILEKVSGKVPSEITMSSSTLKESAKDRKIKEELPKEYEIDPTAFVSMLATELTKVRSGNHSKVLAKNRCCLFNVGGFVVGVHWSSRHSEWRVNIFEFGRNLWGAESVVFYSN